VVRGPARQSIQGSRSGNRTARLARCQYGLISFLQEVMGMNQVDSDRDVQEPQQEKDKPELDLQVKVDSPSACERHVTVTISEQDVRRYFDEAFSELMPTASVPGFRAGRAPRKLVEQRFRSQVSDQVKGSLLMDSMQQVTEKAKLATISEPVFDLEAVEVPDEGPMMFEFDVEVRPEFEMPQWKGLTLQRPVHEFSEHEIDQAIEDWLHQEGALVEIEAVEREGDFVRVNADFRFQGKVVSQLENESICVRPELSFSDAMLNVFEQLMMGEME
jgi:trigger factor